MKETESLIERADKYLFVIERDDAEQALESGKKFVEKIAQHLKA